MTNRRLKSSVAFTLFFITAISHFAFAQDKMGLGVINFQSTSGVDEEQVAVVQDMITNVFVNSDRFMVLERELLEGLFTELELQKEEYTQLTDQFVAQGKLQGAKYLLLGKVSRISIEKVEGKGLINKTSLSTLTEGDEEYLAYVDLTMRLVNTETGKVEGSTNINVKPSLLNRKVMVAGTAAEALQKLSDPIEKQTSKFISEYLPIEIGVGKLITEKKGKVQAVYVLGGEALGLSVGTGIKIYKITQEDVGTGEMIKVVSEIASGKISEMKGEKVSVASIKKGGAALMASLENSETLICRTTN